MPMMQVPFNPKDWIGVLPVSILAIGFLIFVCVWAAEKLGLAKKNSPAIPHKTFADDQERYWRQMREVVTEPLAEVLKALKEILSEFRDRALVEEGRKAERDKQV